MRIQRNLRNKVNLIGRLGKDPEVRTFGKGNKMASFSLATDESYKNGSGKRVQETQWHNVIAWGPQASIVESYLAKGKEVAVEGSVRNRSYQTKSGETRYVSEILVHTILMLGKKESV